MKLLKMYRFHLLFSFSLLFYIKKTIAKVNYHNNITKIASSPKWSSEEFTRLIQFGHIEPNWKDCPKNYVLRNNTCTKTLVESPSYSCDTASLLEDNKCVKFSEKIAQCPPNYSLTSEGCAMQKSVGAEINCPEGFQLIENNMCAKQMRGAPVMSCPSGATLKGSKCFVTQIYPPTYVCSPGYALKNHQCVYETIFDCTPSHLPPLNQPRTNNVAVSSNTRLPINVISRDDLFISDMFHNADTRFPSHSHVRRYRLPSEPSTVEEFVSKKTCKRSLKEPARALCSQGGELENAVCRVSKEVPDVTVSGGIETKIVPATYKCPPDYQLFQTASQKTCVFIEKKPLSFVCYHGYKDIGQKCALFGKPSINCPLQYVLKPDNKCYRVIEESPYNFYTVTYRCQGNKCSAI